MNFGQIGLKEGTARIPGLFPSATYIVLLSFLISKCFTLSVQCLSYKHTEFAKLLFVPRVAVRLGPCSMAGAPSANLTPITLPISSQ